MKKLVLLVFLICSMMGFGMEEEGNKGFHFTLEENKYIYDLGELEETSSIFICTLVINRETVTLLVRNVPKKGFDKQVRHMRYRGTIKKDKLICYEIYRKTYWDILEDPIVYDYIKKGNEVTMKLEQNQKSSSEE
jgi:hypothetical protein